MRLVEINGSVVELEVGEFLRVALSGRGGIHRTALFILVSWWPDVVRVVSCCVEVLVFAHGQGLVVLPLSGRCRSGSLRRLVLIMILVLRVRVN